MKNYILTSIFLFLTITVYGQDKPSTESSTRGEDERKSSCSLSSGAMKEYVEKELHRINQENRK